MRTVFLLLAFAAQCFGQQYDYTLALAGPRNIWAGQLAVFTVQSKLIAGTRQMVDYTVEAPGAATFPKLVATCCAAQRGWQPADTALYVRVRNEPGPAEIRLTTVSGGVTRTAALAVNVLPEPAPFAGMLPPLRASKADVAGWKANIAQYGQAACDAIPLTTDELHESQGWYYDGDRVYRQIAEALNDDAWLTCAARSRALYRGYVLKNAGIIPGYRVFPHGLYLDYVKTGDEQSKQALLLLATKSAYARWGGGPETSLSRETAYMLSTYMLANALGEKLPLEVPVAMALGQLDQWSGPGRPDLQPFMAGLTMEALIGYAEVEHDPRVLPAVRAMLDVLWRDYWHESTQGFRYDDSKTVGAPDLNLLLASSFAWVYRMTGEEKYLTQGDAVFNGGVTKAYLAQGKQFSQSYRSSVDYLKWTAMPTTPPAAEGVSRTEFDAAMAELRQQLQQLQEQLAQRLTRQALVDLLTR